MSHRTTARRVAAIASLSAVLGLTPVAAASADPADTGNPADINTLATSMSNGYTINNCTAQNIVAGELASLTCGQNPDPNGPVQAKYILFDSGEHLAGSFKSSIKDDVLTGCGDSAQSPTTWHQGGPGGNSGQVACGTYQNAAEIIWTMDSKNILSYIRGSNTDASALYQWWRTNG
jgi:hypothetical protein